MVAPLLLAAILSVAGPAGERAFNLAELEAMAQATLTIVDHQGPAGSREGCSGPLLAHVIEAAGVSRGNRLLTAVVAEGADGYRVLFSLGELDPTLGNADIIVAMRDGGKPLPDGVGPLRICAYSDRLRARSVRQLVRLRLVPLD
jgi:hypothetical protein